MHPDVRSASAAFLRQRRDALEPPPHTVVAEVDRGGQIVVGGWRFDTSIALSGRSYLLTDDGRWFQPLRFEDGRWIWEAISGVNPPSDTEDVWWRELAHAMREAPAAGSQPR